MKILFIGDVVGSPGRAIVQSLLPVLKEEYQVDFVICNGENAAHGKGITNRLAKAILSWGVDVITLGNHAYAKREVQDLDLSLPVVFPANLTGPFSEHHTLVFNHLDTTIAVTNICGEAFMNNVFESPYPLMERILQETKADIHIVDFHGETTAEKKAFVYEFKDRVSAVIGTHTHTQTADEQIIDGCAFITDVGMCGAYQSILGRDIHEALSKMIHNETTQYKVSNNPALFSGVLMEFNKQHKAISIERIYIKPEENHR